MMSEATGNLVAWLRADERRFDLTIASITVAFAVPLLIGAREDFDAGWPEVAAGVGAFVLVALRRRWPIPLLTIAALSTSALLIVLERPSPMVLATLVLLGSACVRTDRFRAIGLGVAVAALLYTTALLTSDLEFADERAVIAIAWSAGVVGIADAVRSWRRYRETADAQVRSAVLAADAQARQQVSEERLVIARELHDLLAHNLSVMNVQTGAAMHLLRSDPDRAEAALGEARDAGRSVLDELSELLAVLRHDDGTDAPTNSLPTIDQLPELVETMRSAGLEVNWTQTGAPREVAPAVSLAAYRIVQEALTNAAKHGDGTAALSVDWSDGGVTIRVANAVAGTIGDRAGHGVIGMRERATANGGRFEVHSDQGRHVIEAWLPVVVSSPTKGSSS